MMKYIVNLYIAEVISNIRLKNCYYKQLKRLEQENKELKEANQSLSMLGIDLAFANETVRKEFFRADKNKDMWREKAENYGSALEEIREILKPFAKCYTHTCRNCEKYDAAHACCAKDINCYRYNDGSNSTCEDFTLPTKQFYQQIFANAEYKINEVLK